MRDPYEVLGVPRTADASAIKSAYRKLAKKLHPDSNKNDPKAAMRFAEVNSAYEIVGDEKKRKQFDAGEIDAEGKPRFQGFEGFGAHPGAGAGPGGAHFETFTWGPEGMRRSSGGREGGAGAGGFEDVLKDMFGLGGAGRSRRGGGFGPQHFEAEGFTEPPPVGRDVEVPVTITLAEAAKGGTRRVHLPTGKDVEVKIPAGLSDGQQIRLKGQGLPGPGDRRRRAHHHHRRTAPAVRAGWRQSTGGPAAHTLRSDARGEGAGADPRRRGRLVGSGRHQQRPHVPPQGQGVAAQARNRRPARERAHRFAREERPRTR